MKPQQQIETLDYSQRSPLVYAAARLLVTEVPSTRPTGTSPREADIQQFITENSDSMFTNYALTDMTAGVIAAASVIHGHGDSTNTYISEIAVAPEQQGEGYGGDLLRFIAQQALAHGNDQLSAVPLAPGFFRHFGFRQKQGAILTLAASAHDVLATRKG